MEQVTLNIPDNVAADIQNGCDAPLDRGLLELAAIQAYESGFITGRQVMEMLGFESREELFEIFKRYDVRSKITPELLEREKETAAALFGE
ncbi:MAG: UPF0175 family protein [Acidobacteria bacterium]|nr:UPF0175 family protein [Acidobacteriota bacterium]